MDYWFYSIRIINLWNYWGVFKMNKNYEETKRLAKYLAIAVIPGVLTFYVLRFCYQNTEKIIRKMRRGLENLL